MSTIPIGHELGGDRHCSAGQGLLGSDHHTLRPQARTNRALRRSLAPLLVAVGLVLLLIPTAVTAVAAPKAHRAPSPLEQGLQFYRGKTITLIDPGSIGSGLDLSVRLLAPLMASYLHATVNVEDDPVGNMIPAEDTIASSPPNGLTIGAIMISTLASQELSDAAGVTFNPSHLAFLGGPPASPSVWIASPSSPYTTWKSVVHSVTPVKMLSTQGGTLLYERVIDGAFGLHVNLVLGYSSGAAELAGFIRGDGPVATFGFGFVSPEIASGAAVPILISSAVRFPPALAPKMKGVPTLADIVREYPPKSKIARQTLQVLATFGSFPETFIAPGGVPGYRILALRTAIERVFTNKALYPEEFTQNQIPGYVSGATAKLEWLQASRSLKYLALYNS